MPVTPKLPLAGTRIAITRPVGSGGALARRVRALGGEPLSLPGVRLRAAGDADTARASLRTALACDIVIFSSPAAVRFAAALASLRTRARVLAPGRGTAHALRRAGLAGVITPEREDSEGLLALPQLHDVRGRHIGIIGAAGGRGLLQHELVARGGSVTIAHVYERAPARLDRRHANTLLRAPRKPLFVWLTSAQALDNILAALPTDARRHMLAGTAVASSERLVDAAHRAGFQRVLRAASVQAGDLLAATVRGRP
ncbi:MAG TPA: uroporphyrinogen-III synthase [Rhodanobacteraceae bacterium]|nr:uroporphyrinogen-III synthase [Rhodanobacteraceae bacterium]